MLKVFALFVVSVGIVFRATAGAEADDVLAALDAEIAGVGDVGDGASVDAPEVEPTVDQKPNAAVPSAAKKQKASLSKDGKYAVAVGYGKGDTEEDAKQAAFRNAIENAVGVFVDAESVMQNYEMVKDRVNTISNGDIKKYEVLKSGKEGGFYTVSIKALVEKKAIAPKFKDVFPDAFGKVDGSGLESWFKEAQKRASDAAGLMKAALQDVNPMRDWCRLTAGKGEVTDSGASGKRRYTMSYSMQIDHEKYMKSFVPHFELVLSKIQEGESKECSLVSEKLGSDVRPMKPSSTSFVDPVLITGFPAVTVSGPGVRGAGGNPTWFMYDQYKGLKKVQHERTCNIWLLDKLNKYGTVLHCTAFRVPESALRVYWEQLYGKLDSDYVLGNASKLDIGAQEKVEVALLDSDGEEVAVQYDLVPSTLLTCGMELGSGPQSVTELWKNANVFETFFVRPMFVQRIYPVGRDGGNSAYSSEILRKVSFQLTGEQLAAVKKVRVRFARGKKVRTVSDASDQTVSPTGRRTRR